MSELFTSSPSSAPDAFSARRWAAVGHSADTDAVRTVAEGIEDGEQLARLRGLGCTLGQGYLFARPLAAADVTALLGGGLALAA